MELYEIEPFEYSRGLTRPAIKGSSVAADRRTLSLPRVRVSNYDLSLSQILPSAELDLDNSAIWDDTQYATASNRAGKDFCWYLLSSGTVTLSANATAPIGHTVNDSMKLGGFHCEYVDIGTITGHPLTGFVAGDILPASVWDLGHRPTCDPAGMVYCAVLDLWVDIYLQSGTGASTASVAGATIIDTRIWNDHVDDLAAVGKVLLDDTEFQIVAEGSNQRTNIAGSANPVTTGGHRDTAGATAGTSTSAAAPSTDISAAANPQSLTINLNGTGPVAVSFDPAGLNTGALIAEALQVAIRAAVPWAGGMTVTYGTTYVVSCHGSVGPSASVVITAGAGNDCTAALKLGVANGGVETVGNLGRRMVSNYGIEDCCGALFQWLRDQSYRNDDASYLGTWGYYILPGNKGSIYRQGGTGDIKLLAGGGWATGTSCGSRFRSAARYRWFASSSLGSRGCARRQGA